MKKILIVIFLVAAVLFSAGFQSNAAAASSKISLGAKRVNGSLNITFSNLSKAKKITYELIYNRSGAQEGVVGSVIFKGKGPVTKKILLGTCSGKVCTFHRGISKIKLKIITKYASGATETKSYNIK